ncbi:MAG: DUF4422 domain-containing protein, partial [Clostridia bacterium]|nr:DUF4422 domain-containing protein [Clostridia bacterium]
WLMDILLKVEEQLDTSSYSASDLRVYGYLAERLLDVWVNHHHIRYVECPVKNLENQHWFKKIFNFLKRKFTKKGPQK